MIRCTSPGSRRWVVEVDAGVSVTPERLSERRLRVAVCDADGQARWRSCRGLALAREWFTLTHPDAFVDVAEGLLR